MGAKHLIVNAEDFGRSPGINRGVVRAHATGIVTSTTLAVQGEAASAAAALAAENPKLGIGLCFVFSAGQPLLPPAEIPSLVDASGSFPEQPQALVAARLDDVLAEARMQLRLFRELMNARPTHFDTRQGAHAFPVVLEALLSLCWETGVGVRSLSTEMRDRLRYERVPTTDHFIDSFSSGPPSPERLAQVIAEVQAGTTELACRPAEPGGSTGAEGTRDQELEILTSVEARQALQAAGIRLVSFGTTA